MICFTSPWPKSTPVKKKADIAYFCKDSLLEQIPQLSHHTLLLELYSLHGERCVRVFSKQDQIQFLSTMQRSASSTARLSLSLLIFSNKSCRNGKQTLTNPNLSLPSHGSTPSVSFLAHRPAPSLG